jgi:hypothetical protein
VALRTAVLFHPAVEAAYVANEGQSGKRGRGVGGRRQAADDVGAEVVVAASKTRDVTHHRTDPVHVVDENRTFVDAGLELWPLAEAVAAKPAAMSCGGKAISVVMVSLGCRWMHCSDPC